ncbi:hypothetical protein IAG25_37750 [Caballeronia sp. EK]|uniref:hypothetical protein n=1 Tax=Caballeronia sp. EK TaxID=2767469 RepID=UPI001987B807|nr:hypothetical protein [Caballeronia sp. EK]MBC8642551.1 hypothetical protein [Caballeronia sp. EK]
MRYAADAWSVTVATLEDLSSERLGNAATAATTNGAIELLGETLVELDHLLAAKSGLGWNSSGRFADSSKHLKANQGMRKRI